MASYGSDGKPVPSFTGATPPCIHVLRVTYCHDINSICLICSLSPKSVSKEGSDSSLPPHSVHRRDLSQRHLHFEF